MSHLVTLSTDHVTLYCVYLFLAGHILGHSNMVHNLFSIVLIYLANDSKCLNNNKIIILLHVESMWSSQQSTWSHGVPCGLGGGV